MYITPIPVRYKWYLHDVPHMCACRGPRGAVRPPQRSRPPAWVTAHRWPTRRRTKAAAAQVTDQLWVSVFSFGKVFLEVSETQSGYMAYLTGRGVCVCTDAAAADGPQRATAGKGAFHRKDSIDYTHLAVSTHCTHIYIYHREGSVWVTANACGYQRLTMRPTTTTTCPSRYCHPWLHAKCTLKSTQGVLRGAVCLGMTFYVGGRCYCGDG